MRNMTWRTRSVAAIREITPRTERRERELPPGKPGKFKIEKIRAHDFEPPACGPHRAAASRIVFTPRGERVASRRFGRNGLSPKRCGDRADERGLSQEKRADRRIVVSGGEKTTRFREPKKKDLRRACRGYRGHGEVAKR